MVHNRKFKHQGSYFFGSYILAFTVLHLYYKILAACDIQIERGCELHKVNILWY